jgi:hypothetical protein
MQAVLDCYQLRRHNCSVPEHRRLTDYDNGLYLHTTQEHLRSEMVLQVVCRHHGADSGKYQKNGNKYDQGLTFAEVTISVMK